jgi:hypothetical protein
LPENQLARDLTAYWSFIDRHLASGSAEVQALGVDRFAWFEHLIGQARRAGRSPWAEIARYRWAISRFHPLNAPQAWRGPAKTANARVRSGVWTVEQAAAAVPDPTREDRDLLVELQRRRFSGVRGWSW